MVSRVVCFIVVLGLASGATWQGRMPAKPQHHAHKEGCYIREIDDVIPYGAMVSPIGVCYRIECSKHRVSYSSCGVVDVVHSSPNCFITDIDLSRPYPSCCPDIKCDIDNYLI